MAVKWEVWNMHQHGLTHREVYKGETVEIPAGKYILMDYDEAVQFKSQYFPMQKNAQGVQTPESMKMIVLKKHVAGTAPDKEAKKFVSHMDGKEFATQAELDAYVKQHFEGQAIVDEVAEAEIEAKQSRGKRKG